MPGEGKDRSLCLVRVKIGVLYVPGQGKDRSMCMVRVKIGVCAW